MAKLDQYKKVRILIGADICVTKSNVDYFKSGDIKSIVDNRIIDILKDADIRIFNLEGPMIDKGKPIEKCGPNIKMPEASILGIKALDPTILTLANNHIMDFGEIGLKKTMKILLENDIKYVGCGMSLSNMKHYVICESNMCKVGVLSCAEHEFSIASWNTPGAYPYDPLVIFDEIANIKTKVDYLIVLYHGGKEEYRYPTPRLQKVFRKMADYGADLVIAQHTHCIGCKEEYHGSTLVYGQGNFIFDGKENEYWNSGLLVSITLTSRHYQKQKMNSDKYVRLYDVSSIDYVPFEKKAGSIRYNTGNILVDFFSRSKQIETDGFIQTNFECLAKENSIKYMALVHGENYLLKALRRLFPDIYLRIIKKQYGGMGGMNRLMNCIECETHNEILLQTIKQLR